MVKYVHTQKSHEHVGIKLMAWFKSKIMFYTYMFSTFFEDFTSISPQITIMASTSNSFHFTPFPFSSSYFWYILPFWEPPSLFSFLCHPSFPFNLCNLPHWVHKFWKLQKNKRGLLFKIFYILIIIRDLHM